MHENTHKDISIAACVRIANEAIYTIMLFSYAYYNWARANLHIHYYFYIVIFEILYISFILCVERTNERLNDVLTFDECWINACASRSLLPANDTVHTSHYIVAVAVFLSLSVYLSASHFCIQCIRHERNGRHSDFSTLFLYHYELNIYSDENAIHIEFVWKNQHTQVI